MLTVAQWEITSIRCRQPAARLWTVPGITYQNCALVITNYPTWNVLQRAGLGKLLWQAASQVWQRTEAAVWQR